MTRKDQTAGPAAVSAIGRGCCRRGSTQRQRRREVRSSGEEAAEAVSFVRGGRLRAGAVLRHSVGRCGALAAGRSRRRLRHFGGSCLGLGLGVVLHLAGLVAALGLAFCERKEEKVVRKKAGLRTSIIVAPLRALRKYSAYCSLLSIHTAVPALCSLPLSGNRFNRCEIARERES